jgi:hypothetical protein
VLLVHFGPLLLGTWVERGFAHKTKISTQLLKFMFAVAQEECEKVILECEKVGFFFVNFEAKAKRAKKLLNCTSVVDPPHVPHFIVMNILRIAFIKTAYMIILRISPFATLE